MDTTTTAPMFTDETAPPTATSTITTFTSSVTSDTNPTQATTTDGGDDEVPLVVFKPAVKHNDAKKPTQTHVSTFTTTPTTTITSMQTSSIGPSGSSSCRPSPTSMAPSATYTTCPYVRRDGQINPDTQTLPSQNLFTSSQAIFLNALAYGLTSTQSYADNTISFIKTLFLDHTTAINPNANYAQVIRGPPGNQTGTFTGILDFRGLVNVVNAVLVLRETGSQGWAGYDEGMREWAGKYLGWLQGSDQGKQASDAKK
jgi:hypothetical protein